MKIRTLNADEIDVRIGQVFQGGYSLLLYKNARVDMDILDETFGSENWQRDHKEMKGNLYCGVGIYDKDKSQWVWKWDCGTESNTEKEKGESSDAFKRACVNVGIGRELYTAPFIMVACETIREGNSYKLSGADKKRKFIVDKITYNSNREIDELIIKDIYGKLVYSNGHAKKDDSVLLGGKYEFNVGKYKGKTIKQVFEEDKNFLELCLSSPKVNDVIKNNIAAYYKEVGEIANGIDF